MHVGSDRKRKETVCTVRLFRRLVLSRWQQCWPPRAELGHSCRIPVCLPCRRGTRRASAREHAYKFVKYWPARSSALAFVARSVLQGENGTRSDVCRELFVHGDAAVPFSPFPPPRPPCAASAALSIFLFRFCHSEMPLFLAPRARAALQL